MVSWGRAWTAVLKWLAYTVIWGLVGFVFIARAYGILDGKASAAEYATHKKLLEASCPGQDKSMIVVVA